MLLRLVSLACIACLIKGPAMAAPPPPDIAKTVTFIFLADDKRWSRFPEQNGGLAKVDSGLDYAANFSSFVCVA